jgi:hypothetical protein
MQKKKEKGVQIKLKSQTARAQLLQTPWIKGGISGGDAHGL